MMSLACSEAFSGSFLLTMVQIKVKIPPDFMISYLGSVISQGL